MVTPREPALKEERRVPLRPATEGPLRRPRVSAFLRALRPAQWSKNVFVLAALGFALGDRTADPVTGGDLVRTLLAFLAFCLGSSAVYLLNDVFDAEADRAHPEKRHRPIASGEISPRAGLAFSILSALGALGLATAAGGRPPGVVGITALYMGINLAYSLRLKRVVLVDVFCIATGFLLRVEAGGLAAGTEISHWMLLCTLFLALFLALNKRRAELESLGADGSTVRQTLGEYNPAFLDQMVTVLAACTIICYTMYTVDEDTAAKFGEQNPLVLSVPFVAFGIGRYMLLVQTGRGGESPTRIFLGADAWFLVNLLAWLGIVSLAVVGADG